jgi:NAD(P)-dependent dehydrogenase (short-subunit alcohol dehydrogenase family)
MPDSVSMILTVAAAGGAAGKVAEIALGGGVKWLTERFGTHAKVVREQAEKNASGFVQALAERVAKLEERKGLTAQMVEENQKHPQFARILQQALLNAAETSDRDKHNFLAHLVASRLTAKPETTQALAAKLAADAIVNCTRRQFELLALAFVLNEVRPAHKLDPTDFEEWLEVHLHFFDNFDFHEIDARHLVALNCITYNPTSERGLETLLQMKNGGKTVGHALLHLPFLQGIKTDWDFGMAGVSLTSVGSVVGGIAHAELNGIDAGPPVWD